jgi:purine-binding chemotaxis protein CheW
MNGNGKISILDAEENDQMILSNVFNDEYSKRLMEERAAKLAMVPTNYDAKGDLLELITFSCSEEQYSLEASYVQEIIPFTSVTRIPGVPEFILGVFNLHGQLVALMYLRRLLGLKEREEFTGGQVIVIGVEQTEFALLVDSVDTVATIDANELLEAPDFVSGSSRNYIKGVTKEAMTVFDGEVLIRDPRLFVNLAESQQ